MQASCQRQKSFLARFCKSVGPFGMTFAICGLHAKVRVYGHILSYMATYCHIVQCMVIRNLRIANHVWHIYCFMQSPCLYARDTLVWPRPLFLSTNGMIPSGMRRHGTRKQAWCIAPTTDGRSALSTNGVPSCFGSDDTLVR